MDTLKEQLHGLARTANELNAEFVLKVPARVYDDLTAGAEWTKALPDISGFKADEARAAATYSLKLEVQD